MKITTTKKLDLTFKAIIQSLAKLQKEIDSSQLEEIIKVLVSAHSSDRKVFVYGFGRSLLIGKAFSMRLMHLGFKSHVIGEVITPAVNAEDVFIVISRTLSNKAIPPAINIAKNCKARIVVITSKDSPTLKKADNLLVVPDLKSNAVRTPSANTPLGTLFEISTMVLLDCAVAELMHRMGITEEEMEARHANVE
ncbi:MAG: SIS domain-containing protein [Candidatus Bathyarchaeota archaeon]|nr:SIS domain-containing protein [Candidatus Bathyarchaeota archaeon]